MENFYTFDQLQAKAHDASHKAAKAGEMFRAALLQEMSSYLGHQEHQEATFSATKAVLEWKKAIEHAKDSLTVELEDTDSEGFAEETF